MSIQGELLRGLYGLHVPMLVLNQQRRDVFTVTFQDRNAAQNDVPVVPHLS